MRSSKTDTQQASGPYDSPFGHGRHRWGRLLALAAFVASGLDCGESGQRAIAIDKSETSKTQPLVGFTAVASADLNDWRCRYDLSYDRSNAAKISKTCPNSIDPTGTTNRTYSTTIDSASQEKILGALDTINTREMRAYYPSTASFRSRWNDYDFRFLAADGNVVAVRVEGGSDESLPAGVLQIYRAILDGNVRLMQNANDAISSLMFLNDREVANTVLEISLEGNYGGGAPPCPCDGNDKNYGYDARIKNFSKDGEIEQWSGCLMPSRDSNDPKGRVRCHTRELMNSVLEPAQWATLKKSILAASPLSLAEHYPCGSYLDCPSDFSNASLSINVGQAQRKISWPAGQEAQLPANLQHILSVLP